MASNQVGTMIKQGMIAALYGVIFLSLLLVDFALGNGFVAMTHRVFCKIFCFVKKTIKEETKFAQTAGQPISVPMLIVEVFTLLFTIYMLQKYKQYHYRDRIDELLNESKEALRQTNEFLEKWRLRRSEYCSRSLLPLAESSSTVDSEIERRPLTSNVTIMEQYNGISEEKYIQLPEFNPAQIVDVRGWITTSDMRIGNLNLEGGALFMLLRRALKGEAFRWLLKLPCEDLSWIDFKNLLITRVPYQNGNKGTLMITWQGSFSENSYLDEEPQTIKPLNLELPILHMAIVDTLGTIRSQPERGDAGDHISVSDSTLLSVTSFLDNDFRQVSLESIPDEPANEPGVFEDPKVDFPSRLLWDVVEEDSNQSD